MFKKLFFGLLLILAAIAAWFAYQWYFTNDNFMRQINLVPGDAVYVLQTDEPVKNWKKFTGSKLWQHFKQHPKFADIARSADAIDQFPICSSVNNPSQATPWSSLVSPHSSPSRYTPAVVSRSVESKLRWPM